ncbi:hypothetical protein FBF25_01615 [Candidatus Saccharibacteria bacterium oral taxon 488]|nr:hypothetical protein FBF25_01615 [Candidatus Saccharibacteria bacterium oral taxon 488]QLF51754.1 hypothetical protein HW277_01630 [Candidatus Saccharibacteria bacterium oral taxon 488]
MSNTSEFPNSGNESLWQKAGAVLGAVATTALFMSGCCAPKEKTEVTSTAQEQGSPAADTKTDSRGNPDLDWKIVDKGCAGGDDCEEGELSAYSHIAKACNGPTLLYRYYNANSRTGSITAIPNSPECGYTPPTPTSPVPSIEATTTPTNSN